MRLSKFVGHPVYKLRHLIAVAELFSAFIFENWDEPGHEDGGP